MNRAIVSQSFLWLGVFALGAIGFAQSGTHQSSASSSPATSAEHLLGMNAKLLCSGVFVIGRDAEGFIENNLQAHGLSGSAWNDVGVDIDRERKSVTLSREGARPRTAVFNGDQGCTLLPIGEKSVFFTPVKLASALPDAATQPWPTGDLIEDTPLPSEVDAEALGAVLDFALDNEATTPAQNTRAIVVVYRGRIIAERYAPGFDRDTRHITWSMGKSITSALIGILVGDGLFAVDDPAPIAPWREPGDPRGAITIAHLLHMSSGLKFGRGGDPGVERYSDADNHTFVYFGATNVFDYSIGNELELMPDTVWRYRNCDPLTLGKIVKDSVEARGEEYLSFPHRALFDRIGMRRMVLETDAWGNFIMTGFDYGTARDWARFGLLHLNGGVWQGERILPEGWVDFVRTPAPAHPAQGYGGLFWLNAGKRYKSLPEDTYWPAGHHGQVVKIIPSRDMVIVRLGHSSGGGFDRYIEKVVGGILAAVGEPER